MSEEFFLKLRLCCFSFELQSRRFPVARLRAWSKIPCLFFRPVQCCGVGRRSKKILVFVLLLHLSAFSNLVRVLARVVLSSSNQVSPTICFTPKNSILP